MSVDFASPIAELGASIIRTLGNATARFNGSGTEVAGIFRNLATVASVGSAGAYAREPEFRCMASDLAGELLTDRVAIEIDSQATSATWYVVKERLPDEPHTGHAIFLLEPAA